MIQNWVDLEAFPVEQLIGPKPAGRFVALLKKGDVFKVMISANLFDALFQSWRDKPSESGMQAPLETLWEQAADALRTQIAPNEYPMQHESLDAKFEATLHEGARGIMAAVTLRRRGPDVQIVVMLADELANHN